MTSSINIYAGPKAFKRIQSEGLHQQLFNVMAGASGGPKWFTLFGLDCYLFGEFFAHRKEKFYTIGSSAGAWRMACFAQKKPVDAIQRLAHYYSNEIYSKKPNANEITQKARIMLNQVLGETGATNIVNHPLIQSHFIVARAKGLNVLDNNIIQLAGLITAALTNIVSRKTIKYHYERFIFHTQNQNFASSFFQPDDLPTQFASLNEGNVHSALMASGSIPMILNGVKNIPKAPEGVYRDGGIIDYHLDLNFQTEKLILYPHFFPLIKPGWFDKNLKSRHAQLKNYQNVVMITPSLEHVLSLPYQKISDRKDFQQLETSTRIKYWQKVLDASHKMAEDFEQLVNTKNGLRQIIPIESILKN